MSGPSITGSSSISKDDILVMIYGSLYTGASTAPGVGVRYSQGQTSTEHT